MNHAAESQKEIPANFMAPGRRSLETIGVSAVQIGGADCKVLAQAQKIPDHWPWWAWPKGETWWNQWTHHNLHNPSKCWSLLVKEVERCGATKCIKCYSYRSDHHTARGPMTQGRQRCQRPPRPRFRCQAAVGSEERAATLQARYGKVTPSRHVKICQDMAMKTSSEAIDFLLMGKFRKFL